METTAQTASRLLAVLEEFAADAAALLRARQFSDAAALMHRASPIVDKLASLAPSAPHLRERVRDFLARQRADLDLIAQAIAETRDALAQVDGARGRVMKVAPVYVTRQVRPRFNAEA